MEDFKSIRTKNNIRIGIECASFAITKDVYRPKFNWIGDKMLVVTRGVDKRYTERMYKNIIYGASIVLGLTYESALNGIGQMVICFEEAIKD